MVLKKNTGTDTPYQYNLVTPKQSLTHVSNIPVVNEHKSHYICYIALCYLHNEICSKCYRIIHSEIYTLEIVHFLCVSEYHYRVHIKSVCIPTMSHTCTYTITTEDDWQYKRKLKEHIGL